MPLSFDKLMRLRNNLDKIPQSHSNTENVPSLTGKINWLVKTM